MSDGLYFTCDIFIGGGKGMVDKNHIYNYAIPPEEVRRLAAEVNP